jgi:hypothetical protein
MHGHSVYLLGFSALLGFAVAVAIVVFRRYWTAESRLRSCLINGSLTVCTLALLLLAGEAYFFYENVQPDSFRFTLASQRWFELYWTPINSLGYRDAEYTSLDFVSKRSCLIVGDSFAAGSGIEKDEDRFAAVLAHHLGEDWIVPIVAKSGWDTNKELQALKDYPHEPDVVVLQYYMNDILESASHFGHQLLPPIERPRGMTGFLTRHSFLFDRLYWTLFRMRLEQTGETFWDRLKGAYADDEVWGHHRKSLRSFAEYAEERGIELLVVIIPNLLRVKESQPIAQRLTAAFDTVGVPVVDLSAHLADRDPRGMVVNAANNHANEALNRDIGRWLFETLKDIGWAGMGTAAVGRALIP